MKCVNTQFHTLMRIDARNMVFVTKQPLLFIYRITIVIVIPLLLLLLFIHYGSTKERKTLPYHHTAIRPIKE